MTYDTIERDFGSFNEVRNRFVFELSHSHEPRTTNVAPMMGLPNEGMIRVIMYKALGE